MFTIIFKTKVSKEIQHYLYYLIFYIKIFICLLDMSLDQIKPLVVSFDIGGSEMLLRYLKK